MDEPNEPQPLQHSKALQRAPQPMQVDARRVVAIGTGIWLVALIVLLPLWDWLGRHDHRIWLWTCVAGVMIGLGGSLLVRRHRAQGRAE